MSDVCRPRTYAGKARWKRSVSFQTNFLSFIRSTGYSTSAVFAKAHICWWRPGDKTKRRGAGAWNGTFFAQSDPSILTLKFCWNSFSSCLMCFDDPSSPWWEEPSMLFLEDELFGSAVDSKQRKTVTHSCISQAKSFGSLWPTTCWFRLVGHLLSPDLITLLFILLFIKTRAVEPEPKTFRWWSRSWSRSANFGFRFHSPWFVQCGDKVFLSLLHMSLPLPIKHMITQHLIYAGVIIHLYK